ncbi:hypothetical protein GCM10009098_34430 [Rheinheimera aquimaris]|uniref:Lipoprotein n=1 Tax=Rheinheimera aquimaris TaxID=412437 RepID=A0ABP3PET1_9GAMM
MRYIIIIFALLTVSACAGKSSTPQKNNNSATSGSTQVSGNTDDVSDEQIICRLEKEIGSNKRVRTCRKVSGT